MSVVVEKKEGVEKGKKGGIRCRFRGCEQTIAKKTEKEHWTAHLCDTHAEQWQVEFVSLPLHALHYCSCRVSPHSLRSWSPVA